MLHFYGPLRLLDSTECQPVAPSSSIDEVVRAYREGDDATVPADLRDDIYQRAVSLWITEQCESARLLLVALTECDAKCGQLLTSANSNHPSWLRIVEVFLLGSPDDFGTALESTNPQFLAVDGNQQFMRLLWTAFVEMCSCKEELRVVASRIFPLMVFVARCPEGRGVALAAAVVGVADDSLVCELAGSGDITEQVLLELFHFVGREHACIPDWFIKNHPAGKALPRITIESLESKHAVFLDMMSVFVSVGYAAAPQWPHHIVSAVERYAREASLAEVDAEMDELVASLLYKAVAITEPFHLARRIITIALHVAKYHQDTVFTGALQRFLENKSAAITSQEARRNHQITIEKVLGGLQLLESCEVVGVRESVAAATRLFFAGTEYGETGKNQKVAPWSGCVVQVSQAPYFVIPDSSVSLVKPTTETRDSLYDSYAAILASHDPYSRFRALHPLLDPQEVHILGIPANKLVICFNASDAEAARADPSARVVLLQSE